MTKVFACHAHTDYETVTGIAGELRHAGLEVWIDTRNIQAGALWGGVVAKAIADCDVFLIFISSHSLVEDLVRRQMTLAADAKKRILRLILEDVQIPSSMEGQLQGTPSVNLRVADWKTQLLALLGIPAAPKPPVDTGRLKNPYSSLPVLEPVEHKLILSNREKELKKAIDYLEQHRLLLITGMPGIGKSTFARALLEFMPAGSPPPFWYNFERQRSSGNSLSVLLERISGYLDICLGQDIQREVMAFRESEKGNASVDEIDLLISYLDQGTPFWLVFDNLETVLSRDTSGFLDEGLELLFDSLKNTTHDAKIIITNPFVPVLSDGEPFLEAGTRAMTLEGLDDPSAVAFLQAYGLEDLSEESLAPLVQEINGHPFVLNHIAHYIQAMGVSAALENLQGGLEEIRERFGDSLKKRLSAEEHRALQSLTVLNREIRLNGLCLVAQARPSTIMRLRQKGLLQTSDSGHFWMHSIVRNSIKPGDPDVSREAHLRAVEFYRQQSPPPAPESIDDYAGALEWHFHAVEAGDARSAYSALYSTGMKDQLMRWNEYELLAKLCERILSAVYQTQTDLSQGDTGLSNSERIDLYHTLGVAYFLLGEFVSSIAHLKVALEVLQEGDDKERKIKVLIDLSESYNSIREMTLAMEKCNDALALFDSQNNSVLYARALNLRGIIHRDMGNLNEALSNLEKAFKIFEGLNDHIHCANITGDLGIVYYSLNQFAKALISHRHAIALYRLYGDFRGAMIGHFNLGDILLLDDKHRLALKEFQAALDLARKKKIQWMELDAGLYLVESLIALSHLETAEKELRLLQPIIAKHTSPRWLGMELFLRAYLFWKMKRLDEATACFQSAFVSLETKSCEYDRARIYIKYANLMLELRRIYEAKEALEKSKKIFTDLNIQLGIKAVAKMYANI